MSTTTFPDTDTVDARGVRTLMNEVPGVRIIDVRTGGEFKTVHIPGSYNIPLSTLDEHIDDLADVNHRVVLVCKSGGRASQAHSTLRNAGKDRLHLLEGGIDAWQAAGLDVVHGASETWAMDRQVRLVAGAISLAAIVASIFVPKAKWISGAVATGLTFSAITNTCAMANVLGRLPYNRSDGCDIEGTLARIRQEH